MSLEQVLINKGFLLVVSGLLHFSFDLTKKTIL